MATDKDKLLSGIRFIAIGFPFLFMGPIVLTWVGIPQMHEGNYLWLILSILFMLIAAYFCVRGLRTILAAFFDKQK